MIYLDHNATMPLLPESRDAMMAAMDIFGNPSSVHGVGRAARKHIESARTTIANVLNIESRRIIFTSGATESNNMALRPFQGDVFISGMEHDSVLTCRNDANVIKTLNTGIIDMANLEHQISKAQKPFLVSVTAAHNETGILQPIHDILTCVKKYGGVFHTDAVQGLGRISFDYNAPDMVSLSAHKIGGPKGVGILIINPDIHTHAHTIGGGQERSYRAGTENVTGVAGMAAAFENISGDAYDDIYKLKMHMEKTLKTSASHVKIIGDNVDRLPNTTLMAIPGVKSETQVMFCDMNDIAVSAGSACSSGKVKMSRALSAMGFDESISASTLRVSLSPKTTQTEINQFVTVWQNMYNRLFEYKDAS